MKFCACVRYDDTFDKSQLETALNKLIVDYQEQLMNGIIVSRNGRIAAGDFFNKKTNASLEILDGKFKLNFADVCLSVMGSNLPERAEVALYSNLDNNVKEAIKSNTLDVRLAGPYTIMSFQALIDLTSRPENSS